MRGLAIGLVLLAAATARGDDLEWAGAWTREGGGDVTIRVQGGRYVLAASVRERTVSFEGRGAGSKLELAGTLSESRGLTGALAGEERSVASHACKLSLAATREADADRVAATFTLDGSELRRETWTRRRPLLEVLRLEADGAPVAGALDLKLSRTGLVVVYLLRGSDARALRARIVPRETNKHGDFYGGRAVHERSLGTVAPGEHRFAWDGRDGTSAARIALEGEYDVCVLADGEEKGARATLRVAPPRFVYLSGNSPHLKADGLDPPVEGRDRGERVRSRGYGATDPTGPTRGSAEMRPALESAAVAVVSAHGVPGSLGFYTGDPSRPEDPSLNYSVPGQAAIATWDLRDLRLVFVSVCEAATPGPGTLSLVDSFLKAGCDVAIGSTRQVSGQETKLFEQLFLDLVDRGDPIEKAARDTARRTYRERSGLSDLTEAQLDALLAKERAGEAKVGSLAAFLVVKRAPGVAEDEGFWPPRYGDSKH